MSARAALRPEATWPEELELYILAERELRAGARLLRLTTYSDGAATVAVENTDEETLRQMCLTTDGAGLERLRQMIEGALRDLEGAR